MKKKIALTYGDPQGIGLEILNRILQTEAFALLQKSFEFCIFGSPELISAPENVELCTVEDSNPCEHSFRCLEAAAKACLAGNCQGLVTGPISKYRWIQAGHNWKGQTELLGHLAEACPEMLFVCGSKNPLRVLLLTRHIPLKSVSPALTFERFQKAHETLKNFLKKNSNIQNPTIALAGLNPHAGENGEIGLEEKEFYTPWCQALGLKGPFSPDDVWTKAARAYLADMPQSFDAYLAPYHDQVLPLIKAISNFEAVNVSIGLPFIRTSPDHGTAFDLVGTGKARHEPFLRAIELCCKLVAQ